MEAQTQTERVQVLEERTKSLWTEVVDSKASMSKVERHAKDLKVALVAEKEKATH